MHHCARVSTRTSALQCQHAHVSSTTSALQSAVQPVALQVSCQTYTHTHMYTHKARERALYLKLSERKEHTRKIHIHICTRAHTEQESEHATSYVMTNVPSDIYTHAHVLVHVHMCTCACERGTHVQYACTVLLVCSPLSHDILSLS